MWRGEHVAYVLTFRSQRRDALFFPNSLLAEGRNVLMAAAAMTEFRRGRRFAYKGYPGTKSVGQHNACQHRIGEDSKSTSIGITSNTINIQTSISNNTNSSVSAPGAASPTTYMMHNIKTLIYVCMYVYIYIYIYSSQYKPSRLRPRKLGLNRDTLYEFK